jgi:hypothetical protein
MGRLYHVKETLPRNIADCSDYPNNEFCVLDYSSNDGLEEWIHTEMREYLESGVLLYKKHTGETFYHAPKAKNIIHAAATGDVFCDLDADNFCGKGFSKFINKVMSKNPMAIGAPMDPVKRNLGAAGRIFLHRALYEELGGYDEGYVGWSFDDDDLVERGIIHGGQKVPIPTEYLDCIPNPQAERRKNLAVDLSTSFRQNRKRFMRKIETESLFVALDRACHREGRVQAV